MLNMASIADECGTLLDNNLIAGIVKVESAFNPYAIGVVNGRLARQPTNKEDAIATAKNLQSLGWNFSLGLGQINYSNLDKYNLSIESAFEPCENLRATIAIFSDCLRRASAIYDPEYAPLAAFSCYYSGNFTRGFVQEGNKNSYVERVSMANTGNGANLENTSIPLIQSDNHKRNNRQVIYRSAPHITQKITKAKVSHRVHELRGF